MCSRLLGCLHIWTLSEELISIYNYLPSNHKLKPIPPISIHLGSALPCLPHFLFVSPVFHIRNSSSQQYQHIYSFFQSNQTSKIILELLYQALQKTNLQDLLAVLPHIHKYTKGKQTSL